MRTFLKNALVVGLMAATMFGAVQAQDIPNNTAAALPAYRSAFAAAHASARQQLGKPVRFDVKQFKVVGDWVFLHARMLDSNGQPVSYAGTRFAEADQHGQKSSNYDALLQHAEGHWTVRADSVGATDVPWTNWSRDYAAPAGLFDADAAH